ncbi:hypothetical protein CKALI_00710 [Corynebacterium kalinowskii]|uniref:Uncharacterized protein n=1 Tax=Corynebacterium kalinowskii TaxID=2675216 RepID=A0A6B8V9I8_9CORY|nr:hypothetical protein CKALI_00710 [Corynebacterium kalinowskii]
MTLVARPILPAGRALVSHYVKLGVVVLAAPVLIDGPSPNHSNTTASRDNFAGSNCSKSPAGDAG